MTKTVHPVFDPKTMTWFVDGYKTEAPSLRELKIKFGSGFRFKGYDPDGYVRGSWPVLPCQSKKVEAPRPRPIPKAPQQAHKPFRASEKNNRILDMWAQGISGPEIGRRLGLPHPFTAGTVVASARLRGDPRALVRNAARIKWYHHD